MWQVIHSKSIHSKSIHSNICFVVDDIVTTYIIIDMFNCKDFSSQEDISMDKQFISYVIIAILAIALILLGGRYTILKQFSHTGDGSDTDLRYALYNVKLDQNYEDMSDEEIIANLASSEAYCKMALRIVKDNLYIMDEPQIFIGDLCGVDNYLLHIIDEPEMIQDDNIKDNLKKINKIFQTIALSQSTQETEKGKEELEDFINQLANE